MRGVRSRKELPNPRQLSLFDGNEGTVVKPLTRLSLESMRDGASIPRKYQEEMAKSALSTDIYGNVLSTLVVLPTGTGKTHIAAMVTGNRIAEGTVIFIVPTSPLVAQQSEYMLSQLKLGKNQIAAITGDRQNPSARAAIYSNKPKVIVGTSQSLSRDINSGRLSLDGVSMMIFDEAHHCVGEDAYRIIARAAIEKNIPRLGLTASPGNNRERILRVVENLGINNIAEYTKESAEIRRYIPPMVYKRLDARLPRIFLQIRTRLAELSYNALAELGEMGMLVQYYGMPDNFHAVSGDVRSDVTPDDVYRFMKFGELDKLKKTILAKKPKFQTTKKTPYHELPRESKIFMRAMSLHSELMFYYQLLNMFETQSIRVGLAYINRTLGLSPDSPKKDNASHADGASNSAEREKTFKGRIRSSQSFMSMYNYLKDNINVLPENPKIALFREVINKNPSKKMIIFTEYRDQARLLYETAKSDGHSVSLLLGKSHGTTGKHQEAAINNFREGKSRILVSTRAGQEGLDIPLSEMIVHYDISASAIAHIQRNGRGSRSDSCSVYYLVALDTKDEYSYISSMRAIVTMENSLHSIRRGFNPDKGILRN